MVDALMYAAIGVAVGLVLLIGIAGAMRVREDQIRRILDDEFLVRPEDWGDR